MTEILLNSHCSISTAEEDETITLAHGEGGRLLRRLLRERILPRLGDGPRCLDDAAVLSRLQGEPAFTTDSFVVSPLFFPGGDIGKLAVIGTVNDLAVSGAQPLWISLGLIIEEGLPLSVLDRVLESLGKSALEAGVTVVAGDTKVVPRGAADKLFINTAGIGEIEAPILPGPSLLQPGDEILVSGPIGKHGIAVMTARENLGFEPPPESDCAPLTPAVSALRTARIPVRAIRDATRGGVAAVLHEWAEASRLTMTIDQSRVPVSPEVAGACELLGLDPLHVANEGTMVVAVPPAMSAAAIDALRTAAVSKHATCIGLVEKRALSPVLVVRGLGRAQPLDEPLGAPLPRIC